MRFFGLAAFAQKWINRNFYRSEARVEAQDDALFILDDVFVVSVEHEGEHGAVNAGGRLNHPRPVACLGVLVEIGEVLAAKLGMLIEIEAAALGDTFQFAPAEGIEKLNVG